MKQGRLGPLAGAGSVLSGVLGAGLFTYLFLGLAGRTLGAEEMGPVSTLWAMVFVVGPGLFLPAQQELARILGGQRSAHGGGDAARRVSVVVAGVALTAVVVTLAARGWVTEELLGGADVLFWCFVGAIVAFAVNFVTRGLLAGLGDFRGLGMVQALESLVRLGIASACVLSGWRSPVVFGLALAVAPLVAAVVVSRGGRRLRLAPGQPVGWRDAGRSIGWLLVASFMMQLLANAGPLAVQLQADAREQALAAQFFSALVIARGALFLFQALQATVVPNLAELVGAGRADQVRGAVRRLVLACSGLTVVVTASALLLGPLAVRVLFGSDFVVASRTMGVLAAASTVQVMGIALGGAAIAARLYALNAVAWVSGCLAFVAALFVPGDVFVRVEVSYLVGCLTSTTILLVGIRWLPRRISSATPASRTPADGRSTSGDAARPG